MLEDWLSPAVTLQGGGDAERRLGQMSLYVCNDPELESKFHFGHLALALRHKNVMHYVIVLLIAYSAKYVDTYE